MEKGKKSQTAMSTPHFVTKKFLFGKSKTQEEVKDSCDTFVFLLMYI